jgi:hypothetical protein
MRARFAGVALLSAGLLAACGAVPPAVELTSGYASGTTPYGQLLPRYTREAQLYDGFDTVAKGSATWRSLELRRAAVAASAERYLLDDPATRALLDRQEQEARAAREFHLALYTPHKEWNDLEAPGTLWRAYLELPDGERLEALEVSYLRKTDKARVEYPYVTPWTREYALRFPLSERGETHRHLTLVLTGALGTLRFAF